MNSGIKKKVYFIIGLLLLSVGILVPTFVDKDSVPEWWPSRPINLGLDLRGGSYLMLGVQTEEAVVSQLTGIAQSVRSEMRKEKAGLLRAKQRGGTEVEFTLLGDRGLKKLEDYMKSDYPELVKGPLEKSGAEVKISYSIKPEAAKEIEKNAVLQAIETIRNRVDYTGVREPTIQRAGLKRIVVQLPSVTNLDQVKATIGSVAKLEFRLVANENTPSDQKVRYKHRDGGFVFLRDEVLMSGDAIEKANVDINPSTNQREVTLKLNAFGKGLFGRITSENVGRQLAIVLDNVVQSDPRINEAITGGQAQISGGFTPEESHRLAVVLRSGALPAPLTFEEERTVGPSLGADSIEKGINSMVLGTIIVILFTILYYRKSGILAVSCLFANVLFLLSLLTLFGATLTLPGIAGLILTVGMAVDANVIIFERIKEELRIGASPGASVDAGFLKAHWTILDANITTLLTGVILYSWGTGPIKGFAVTLSLGILTSMFTALYVGRVGFSVFNMKNAQGRLSI
jgi:preprotein translocase subunit SecD